MGEQRQIENGNNHVPYSPRQPIQPIPPTPPLSPLPPLSPPSTDLHPTQPPPPLPEKEEHILQTTEPPILPVPCERSAFFRNAEDCTCPDGRAPEKVAVGSKSEGWLCPEEQKEEADDEADDDENTEKIGLKKEQEFVSEQKEE